MNHMILGFDDDDSQRLKQVNEQDLFDNWEELPKEVLEVLNKYLDDLNYQQCEDMLKEMESVGYTFEYYLDAVPFNLKKI